MNVRDRRLNMIGSIALVGLLGATVVVAAVNAKGYKANDVTLHDAGVWVTRGNEVGRLNTQLRKIDMVLTGAGNLMQHDETVLLEDASGLAPIDVGLGTAGAGAKYPDGGAVAGIGGENGAILAPKLGKLWFTDRTAIASVEFDKPSEISVDAADADDVVVDAFGAAHTVDIATGATGTWHTPDQVDPDRSQFAGPLTDGQYVLTTVGDRLVALDRKQGTLQVDGGGSFPMDELGDLAAVQLQWPGPAADGVVVTTPAGLYRVGLSDGSVTILHDGEAGAAARSVVLNGCVYGAWTTTSVRLCGEKLTKGQQPGENEPPIFRVNRGLVVVNAASGKLYLYGPQGTTLIDDWSDAFDPSSKPDVPTDEQRTQEIQECDATRAAPPIAEDDNFVVRLGDTALLDVLFGLGADQDPNCDVLIIESTTPAEIDGSFSPGC